MTTPAHLSSVLTGRYDVQREIGAGGMATVYLARDLRHDREVALKVLRPDLAAVLGVERFLNEIRITARLDHPHILTLIDSGATDGVLWYVLPYIRGESVRARLLREKQLGIDEAIRITQQIGSALEYAHRQGVIHRDIKPENILLFEGEAMLADFGIALAVKEAGGNRLTETGLSLGTPQYMSPEQATGERQPDARSDVYSLGAVLYEMLTGEAPHTGATAQVVIAKLLTERPTRVRIVRDTVTEELDNAVSKALAKTPADRFASAGELVHAVTSAVTASSVAAASGRRNRGLIAGVAAAAAAIAAIALVPTFRGRFSAPPPAPQTTQLTATGGSWAPSLSPDGNFLAYVTEQCAGEPKRCTQSLIVQDLASNSRPTTVASNLDAVHQSRWSPDGTRIFFSAGQGAVSALFSVPRFGGTVERIGPYFTYAVAPDSARVIAPDIAYPSDTFARVSILKRTTGELADSLKLPGLIAHDARWSPNGRWLVVVTQAGGNARFTLLNAKLEVVDRAIESRINLFRYSGQVRWTPKSDGLYFLAEGAGIRAYLVRRGVDAGKGRFTGTSDTLLSELRAPAGAGFDVSADGKTVVYSGGPVTRELWSLERRGSRGPWTTRRILASTAGLTGADISDDGLQIAYGVLEPSGDKARVWIAPFDGGEAHPVGVPYAGLTGPTWPRYLGARVRITFKDEQDSTRSVLLPAAGGPPEPLPAKLTYLAGLLDGGRFIERATVPNAVGSLFQRVDKDGKVLDSRPWPDSLGAPNVKVASAVNNDVFVLSMTLRAGSTMMRLHRLDPVSGRIETLRDIAFPPTWTGLLQAQTDGRLVFGDQPGFFAGTKLRLSYLDVVTGRSESEELPLAFSEVNITHEGHRAVGIVDARQSDVWMVKNFDPRNGR